MPSGKIRVTRMRRRLPKPIILGRLGEQEPTIAPGLISDTGKRHLRISLGAKFLGSLDAYEARKLTDRLVSMRGWLIDVT